jgi:hypothetical protein
MLTAHLPVRFEEIGQHVLVDLDVTKPPVMRVRSHTKTGIAGDIDSRGARGKLLSLHGLSLGDDAG